MDLLKELFKKKKVPKESPNGGFWDRAFVKNVCLSCIKN
jgi:hypothetical protein